MLDTLFAWYIICIFTCDQVTTVSLMHHYSLPVITSQQCIWCIITLYLWSHHKCLMHHYTLPVITSQQCLWCIITLYLWSSHNSVFDASLHFSCDQVTTVSLMHHYTLPVIKSQQCLWCIIALHLWSRHNTRHNMHHFTFVSGQESLFWGIITYSPAIMSTL